MILFRSLFFQLLQTFVIALFILTFVLSMDTTYKLINLIVSKGAEAQSVGLMLLYRLPQFLAVTLPLALGISVVVLISRMSLDSEITALRASGISFWKIGQPIFAFGVLGTALGSLITLWLQPSGYAAFEQEKLKMLKSHTAQNIRPKILNFDFPGKVLYARDKSDQEELSGVFITDQLWQADSVVAVSSHGRIDIQEKQEKLLLKLFDGELHQGGSSDEYRIIDFKTLLYHFDTAQNSGNQKSGHVWGMPTESLIGTSDIDYQMELMLRLTTPWACLAFALGMMSLAVSHPRSGASGAYLRALSLVICYYILWMGAKEMSLSLQADSKILWLPPLLIALFGLYNLQRLERDSPGLSGWFFSMIGPFIWKNKEK